MTFTVESSIIHPKYMTFTVTVHHIMTSLLKMAFSIIMSIHPAYHVTLTCAVCHIMAFTVENGIKHDYVYPAYCMTFTGTKQRLLLLTVFSLSVKYKPADVSLAVSCGLLPLLFSLCENFPGFPSLLQPLQAEQDMGQLDTILKVASYKLLQILAITTG